VIFRRLTAVVTTLSRLHEIHLLLFSPLGKLADQAIYFACVNFFFFIF